MQRNHFMNHKKRENTKKKTNKKKLKNEYQRKVASRKNRTNISKYIEFEKHGTPMEPSNN